MPFGPDISWPGGYNGLEYRGGDYNYPAQPGAQEYPGQQYSSGHQFPSQPSAQLPAPQNYGEHPYASYNTGGHGDNGSGYAQPAPDAFGYGDPGYSNPGYDGPSSQDAGVAGTRTVRGFVESGHQGGVYPALPALPAQPALPAPTGDYSTQGYGQPASYSQPWDYNQPLRYDDESAHQGSDPGAAARYPAEYRDSSYGSSYNTAGYETGAYEGTTYDSTTYDSGSYDSGSYEPAAYKSPAYEARAYNGSEMSRPGIDGLGYDLSEIIGTADFPAFGYDEPSVDRLSYDDPRFDDVPGGQDGYGDHRGSSRYDDGSRFDETRLDNFWPDGDDRSGPWFGETREEGGRGGVSRDRSEYRGLDRDGGARTGAGAGHGGQRPSGSHRAPASNETRLDLGYRSDQVRRGAPALNSAALNSAAYASGPLRLSGPMKFDSGLLRMSGPMRFDETRLDNMAALAAEPSRTATGLLAPPEFAPIERSWVDETSLDSFGGLELDLLGTPGTRDSGAFEVEALVREDRPATRDTGSQRTVGRRRGRSSDRRQWLALGAVAVFAAGAIAAVLSNTGVLSKFAFSGPSGPAHSISTPTQLDAYKRSPSLEKAMDVSGLREQVIKGSSGQASDVQSAVYAQGNMTPGAGGSQQIFMFVGGHLGNSAPSSSITSFKQAYPTAQVVPAGPLGGEAACVTTKANNESVAMCVFFDNDSFGTLVSPAMSTAQLAKTMDEVRPGIEHVQQK